MELTLNERPRVEPLDDKIKPGQRRFVEIINESALCMETVNMTVAKEQNEVKLTLNETMEIRIRVELSELAPGANGQR